MYKLSDLQLQYKNDHFLADFQTYDGKSNKCFMDWITQVGKIAHLTQHPQLQLT